MCLLNIRSLRNKTADFVDYVCETKVDLFAITETWLCPNDDAIRNESCPVGYVLADHSRTGRRGGGTALVYRNSLTVKKIDAGEKTSFEFSEWTVQSASHNLRIILIYRSPYSDEHKVPMSTFFAEFADYVETILLNIRSLRNKTADFVDYVCETKVDLFAITETWLCPNDDAIRNESCPVGYVLADHSRTGRRGGGTALVYRNSLTVKKIDAGEKTSFEFSEWTVQSASHNLRIILIYRSPYSDEHKVPMSTFFAEFADYVETILLSNEELLILGDFNIHIDVAGDSDANKLSDFFESVGLRQHVEQHTHAQGHA